MSFDYQVKAEKDAEADGAGDKVRLDHPFAVPVPYPHTSPFIQCAS